MTAVTGRSAKRAACADQGLTESFSPRSAPRAWRPASDSDSRTRWTEDERASCCGQTSPLTHKAEIFNAGWDDAPAWKAVCECGWEIWHCSTDGVAQVGHSLHVLGGLRPSDVQPLWMGNSLRTTVDRRSNEDLREAILGAASWAMQEGDDESWNEARDALEELERRADYYTDRFS